ncbi:hypothetical protein L6164_013906 [Bauhinia variegata]|uniref:Uncharacterized protein n=1 Tax=Bauhinia variegata TaxID=167791 RepID=A0ACB9NGE6_BAUVA|nr:hypothetical protein L6164_013906 [Bauhinia variegata]
MEVERGVSDKKGRKKDVILQISDTEQAFYANNESPGFRGSPKPEISSNSFQQYTQMDSSSKGLGEIPTSTRSPSPEVRKLSPEPSKPPKYPRESITRRRVLGKSEFSKPKSRLVEPAHRIDSKQLDEKTQSANSNLSSRSSPIMASPKSKVTGASSKGDRTPITPRTPLIGPSGEDEEDDEEVYKTANLRMSQIRSSKNWKLAVLTEWIAFVCIMGIFIASLTIDKLQNTVLWSLGLWKWCVLALVILCGRLVTEWLIHVLVFMMERNFLFKKKVLYFVYGVKKSVQVFIWLSLILLAWGLLFNHGVKRPRRTTRILNYITRALASCLIGAAIWLAKTLLIKLVAASFQSTRFFDRIQESLFHQYILRTLSGPSLMEVAEMVGQTSSIGRLSFTTLNKNDVPTKEEVIDVDKLKKIKQEKVSAWTMKGLADVIRSSGLTCTSAPSDDDEDGEQKDREITSELEARAAAYGIFRNVAKPGHKYIDEEDLLRFMKREEMDNMLPLFEGAVETGKIKRKSLKNWLVKVYLERQSLVHSLNDAKTAVEELNKLASAIVLVIIIIVWLLVMGFLTTQVLVFISSQFLLVVFMFGNTAKTVFEAIIFVFVMHPFDVGDRCVIEGVQMVVEEMNILTTVFLRYDNEKIFYPNSVLASKPISNFYRSPEMGDSVEFDVDVSTSIDSIGKLKSMIKTYLDSKPQHWRPDHSVLVRDFADVNRMKMGLYVTHTINFQNSGEKGNRRSDLVLELKKIFEKLDIKYHLPPQEIHLKHLDPPAPSTFQQVWS